MESKLRSRKFWLVIATFVAGLWATFTETEVDPEMLLSAGGVIIAWLGVQGWADKAQAASGIVMERRLYSAQMNAAIEQMASMQGSQGTEVPPSAEEFYPPRGSAPTYLMEPE